MSSEKQNRIARKLLKLKAKNIHPSSVLPSKDHDPTLLGSVRAEGLQQLLIVRPVASKPGEYELIDGSGRLKALNPEEEIVVDVRENASDTDVFRISEATSKRTEMNTYEKATFYAAYLEAVKKEIGEKGTLTRVAKESLISESQLSQYLTINQLFLKLSQLSPELKLESLKRMGINKLYKLSALTSDPALLDIAKETEDKADNITIGEIEGLVERSESEALMRTVLNDDETAKPSEQSPLDVNVRFQELATRISAMTKNVDSALSQLSSKEMPSQLEAPEKLRTLEKISVSLRRLSYYLNELA